MKRSYLMVAGDKEKQLRKIPELLCDIAMINLEDGVSDKKSALELIIKTYQELDFNQNKKVLIRVNGIDEGGLEEIKKLNHLKPFAIRVAKIKTLEEIERVLAVLGDDTELHLSIETKEIFEKINELKKYPQVTTLYLGILDLLESLGLPQNLVRIDNPSIEYILSRFLIESKMAGKNPVGFMYQEYQNLDMYKQWCEKLKTMGFASASCLSPKQVDIANSVFKIESKEIEKAKYIKDLFEKNKFDGICGFSDEKYGFIDEPIYKDALLLLDSANIN